MLQNVERNSANQQGNDKFKSFVIVREPYGRLVSAYVDKIHTRSVWWDWYGKYIIETFRYRASYTSKHCGSDVSFPEFVSYFIHSVETGIKANPHWGPIHHHCQFCLYDYDYYVHLETLISDMEYIYKSVNETMKSSMEDEEWTTRNKAEDVMDQRDGHKFQHCQSSCSMIERVWRSFHNRGLVAPDVKMPLTGGQCDSITKREFQDLSWKSHLDSVDRIDKGKQRRDAMVELYLQVPLLDRLKVRDIFMTDFELHGYESTPPDMFPELYRH